MVEKPYEWAGGAKLEEHSKQKHKILREYLARYLEIRCQFPQQTRFRLAIVEGFAGGGRYACGTAGSPIIFIEELRAATEAFNLKRRAEGMAPLDIECLLVLNDSDPDAIEALKGNVAPIVAAAKDATTQLHLRTEYMSKPFESAYPDIKKMIEQGRYRSVLVNLDQCGHSWVERQTLADMMQASASVEVFYTFAIESLLSFLQKSNPAALAKQLSYLGLNANDLDTLKGEMNKNAWLGAAERLVLEAFQSCAQYVSPFSINNPGGWRYWLIHFANSYRARQEYNDILHGNSTAQAHFGRSGLYMLSYDPAHANPALYLFDLSGRKEAREQLIDDIPRLVTEFGDAISVGALYETIYNMTPAHTDDVHAAMIESPDLQVVTEAGGERRKGNTITASDTLRIKQQRSFFPMFFDDGLSRGKK
jgi:three-Cys-motif partner protein